MRKILLILVAVCVITVVAASLLVWHLNSSPPASSYQKSINRNLGSHDETNALYTAESIDYLTILSTERFSGSSNPQDYLNPGSYLAYTYANFIDKEVIDYYEARYHGLEGKGGPKYPQAVKMTYYANATHRSEFRMFNTPAPEGAAWHNVTIVMSTPEGLVKFNSGHMRFFLRNESGYQMLDWGFDVSFSDCYVVEMKLSYSEFYAPLAAFWSDVYQIVVLDRNFEPVLICVESGRVVA